MDQGIEKEREEPILTPMRWEQVKKIFDAAIGMPADDRLEFVRNQCSGDTSLEAEVCNLLANYDHTVITNELPAAAALGYIGAQSGTQVLQIGQVIARRFGIIRFINQGGMGEVYEAWDSELLERVALKTIRHEIASSPRVIESFKQEVKRARGISQTYAACTTFFTMTSTTANASGSSPWNCSSARRSWKP